MSNNTVTTSNKNSFAAFISWLWSCITYWSVRRDGKYPHSVETWEFNRWMHLNLTKLLYGILTVSVILQFFSFTEIFAFPFFWVTIITLIAGMITGPYSVHDERSFWYGALWAFIGVAFQVIMMKFNLANMMWIDESAHWARQTLVGGRDHRLIGWCVWGFFTSIVCFNWYRNGYFFDEVYYRKNAS